jgi:hypothetical protein
MIRGPALDYPIGFELNFDQMIESTCISEIHSRKMQIRQAAINQACVLMSDSPVTNGKGNSPSRWTTAAPGISGNIAFLSNIHAWVGIEVTYLERVIVLIAWNLIQ